MCKNAFYVFTTIYQTVSWAVLCSYTLINIVIAFYLLPLSAYVCLCVVVFLQPCHLLFLLLFLIQTFFAVHRCNTINQRHQHSANNRCSLLSSVSLNSTTDCCSSIYHYHKQNKYFVTPSFFSFTRWRNEEKTNKSYYGPTTQWTYSNKFKYLSSKCSPTSFAISFHLIAQCLALDKKEFSSFYQRNQYSNSNTPLDGGLRTIAGSCKQ